MADRQVTFIDADDNPLVVWLKHDRIQLVVMDSRPELEAAELRGFAAALFAAYLAAPLVHRLHAARHKIDGVRDQLAAAGSPEQLVAALDGSLASLAVVIDAMTAATAAVAPESDPPDEAPPSYSVIAHRNRARGWRAGEGDGLLGWGWQRDADDAARTAA